MPTSEDERLLRAWVGQPATVSWFNQAFNRLAVRLTASGEDFTLLADGTRIAVAFGQAPVIWRPRKWLQRLGCDPGRWVDEQYMLELDRCCLQRLVSVFRNGLETPEGQYAAIAAMLPALLRALYAMPVLSNPFWLRVTCLETFWQEALLDPAGCETLPVTVKFSRGQWSVRPGYHGRPRHRYLIQAAHILEEQRQIHRADITDSLAGWIGLLRWYNHYRAAVATRPPRVALARREPVRDGERSLL